ncbi:hypothetical protein BC835DRAFT_731267 [Cytidiella melzeri]|nr:hypothetical protein BC835DRAFT_731267 [Cytidiella melzeri]
MLSPMPKSGRRQSFTDDRNATPPRLSHSLTNSTTYLGPLPPSSGKESSFISALRNLTLATGAPESVNEDDDILLSTGPSARSPGQEVKSLTAMKTSNTVDTTEMDGERQYSPSAPSNLLPPRTDEGDISQNGIAGEAAADVPDQADIAPATLGHMPPLLPPAPLSRPSEVPPFSLIQYGHYVPSIRPPTSSTFLTTLRDEKPIQQPTMRMPPEFIPQAKRLTGAATPGSSHPSQSALSANARIESVSTLERDAVRQFLQLIRILDDARLAGTPRMLRTNVAVQLKTYNQNVYTEAGVTRFKDYAALAEERGIVILGGVMGSAWIALHSNWYGRGRFL